MAAPLHRAISAHFSAIPAWRLADTGCNFPIMKTILTPVDFSSASDSVVEQAAALARVFNGRVVLVSVIQPLVIASEFAPPPESIAEITSAGEKSAVEHLARFQARLHAAGIAAEAIQCRGPAVAHIVEQAKRVAADFIVMGSHGHTAFYELVVGSTTHGVLLRASCPVVIVPRPMQRSPR